MFLRTQILNLNEVEYLLLEMFDTRSVLNFTFSISVNYEILNITPKSKNKIHIYLCMHLA